MTYKQTPLPFVNYIFNISSFGVKCVLFMYDRKYIFKLHNSTIWDFMRHISKLPKTSNLRSRELTKSFKHETMDKLSSFPCEHGEVSDARFVVLRVLLEARFTT